MAVTESDDLSGGSLSDPDREKANLGLKEERERLKWKTYLLHGGAVVVGVFIVSGLCWLSYMIFGLKPYQIRFEHVAVLALTFTVPSLVFVSFVKLLGRNDGMTAADLDNHPIVRLVREAIEAFSKKD